MSILVCYNNFKSFLLITQDSYLIICLVIKKFGGESKKMPNTDEQFGNVSEERRAEMRAEARKNRIPTPSDINEDNIGVLFDKIKILENEIKRILEHLGMKAKFK